MTSFTKYAAALVLAGGITASALAVPFNGEIAINLFDSTVTVNTATDAVTFSPGSDNAMVGSRTGDYAGVVVVGTYATYNDFNYGAGFSALNVWEIDSNTYFRLDAITNVTETTYGGVTLVGTGWAYLAGFSPTAGSWSFSADRASMVSIFSFSSTTTVHSSVPDGGTTAALIGLGLVGLGIIARRRKV
jgi:hypothetical protein